MFATYSLTIRRLFTQSIRRRPNLHVKSEHRRIITEYSLAVRKNCSGQCIFSVRVGFSKKTSFGNIHRVSFIFDPGQS